jgi:demethylmacrocin O-methyltransferase
MWSRYFSNATVFGIDVFSLSELRTKLKEQGINQDFLPEQPESERLKTFVGDQANREHLKAFVGKYGGDFDIVLDDGGHSMKQQQISFGFMFKYVKPGGYYVIEDVHTSLPERYKGFGVGKSEADTTLRMINYFNRYARVKSVYLRPDEMDYLNRNIEYCNLFVRNNSAHSMTCIFKKRPE